MTTFLQPSDMHPDFFVNADKKIKPVTTRNTFVANIETAYKLDHGSLERPTERRTVYIANNGFGYIHLDFYARGTSATGRTFAFRLPENSPTPVGLLETQTHDGGTIWINANSKEIHFHNLTVGQRYIVDIPGFWNV